MVYNGFHIEAKAFFRVVLACAASGVAISLPSRNIDHSILHRVI